MYAIIPLNENSPFSTVHLAWYGLNLNFYIYPWISAFQLVKFIILPFKNVFVKKKGYPKLGVFLYSNNLQCFACIIKFSYFLLIWYKKYTGFSQIIHFVNNFMCGFHS